MKLLASSLSSVIAALGLAAAASAQTVSPTGPITATGQLNQSLAGGQFLTICQVTFQGVAHANGFTFTSYTGTQVGGPGDLACDDSIVFPVEVEALSSSDLMIDELHISTRLGDCSASNIPLTWDNATSSVTFPAGTSIELCEFEGTLTVSPATTIN
ncbi:hypothetical protein FKB34_14825 [Glycocaulis profundi]|nr:hypothetical protein FKB34_14825 [Glycocaulis profundi]